MEKHTETVFSAAFISLRVAFDSAYWASLATGATPETAFYTASAVVMKELAAMYGMANVKPAVADDEDAEEAAEVTILTMKYLASDVTARNIERIREALHEYARAKTWGAKFVWPVVDHGPAGTEEALMEGHYGEK